jgi:hypothetical protein
MHTHITQFVRAAFGADEQRRLVNLTSFTEQRLHVFTKKGQVYENYEPV